MNAKIDPEIEPESAKHRKNPGNSACACKIALASIWP